MHELKNKASFVSAYFKMFLLQVSAADHKQADMQTEQWVRWNKTAVETMSVLFPQAKQRSLFNPFYTWGESHTITFRKHSGFVFIQFIGTFFCLS